MASAIRSGLYIVVDPRKDEADVVRVDVKETIYLYSHGDALSDEVLSKWSEWTGSTITKYADIIKTLEVEVIFESNARNALLFFCGGTTGNSAPIITTPYEYNKMVQIAYSQAQHAEAIEKEIQELTDGSLPV